MPTLKRGAEMAKITRRDWIKGASAAWAIAQVSAIPAVAAELPLDIGAVEVAIIAPVLVPTVVSMVGDVLVALSANDSVTDSSGITASGSERAAY